MKRAAITGAAITVALAEFTDLRAQDYDVRSSLTDMAQSPMAVASVAGFGAVVGVVVETVRRFVV